MTSGPAPQGGLDLTQCALFLDFDGTLAPLQDDPDAVQLPPGGEDILIALSKRLGGALAIISGRDIRDLSTRVPGDLWRAGNHGDVLLAPGDVDPARIPAPPPPLVQGVRAIAGAFDGVRLEEKARVLAIHTRKAPHHGDMIADALEKLAATMGDYSVQRGKDVIELKPKDVHKGRAVETLLGKPAFQNRPPIFFGDDTTDEDGFHVCLRLGGTAVKVGDGSTLAPHRVADPNTVWGLLRGAAQ